MKIGAIVQARMSSGRLPGKVLREVAGKPILQYLLERLGHCRELDAVTVCTSSQNSDEPIADFCRRRRVDCFRGCLSNVAQRYRDALRKYPFDAFVRVSGDSPLLDQGLVDHGLRILRQGEFEIVTNNLARTFPSGQTVEILRTDTFLRGFERMRADEDFEHVTRFFYRHHRDYRIFNFTSDESLSGVHLSVDTAGDLDRFAGIVGGMSRPHWQYGLAEILRLMREHAGCKAECDG